MIQKIASIACVGLLISCSTKEIADYDSSNQVIQDTTADAALEALIQPYSDGMKEKMDEVIGYASSTLEKVDPESPLGNFSADIMYAAGLSYASKTKDIGINSMKRSFCLLNFGGLRSPINQGNISVGDIYSLMPFDNTLTLVKLTGEQVRLLAKYLMSAHGQPVSNATFQLSSNSEQMTIGGEAYNFDEDVVVVTSDYLANGGDKMDFFKDPIRKWNSGILMRDIYLDHVIATDTLKDYPVEGRITFVK